MQKIFLLMMFLVLSQITGCTHLPRVYWGADEMRGKVIDAETKEPVKDAVVVAIWQLEGGWFQPQYSANIALLETTTDEEGDFVLDSWGPRFGVSGWTARNTPLLIAYKKGYLFGWMEYWRDNPDLSRDKELFYTTDFITVEMKKDIGVKLLFTHEFVDIYDYIRGDSGLGGNRRRCDWLKVPILTSKMIEIEALNIDSLFSSGNCGVSKSDIEDMVRKYRNEP